MNEQKFIGELFGVLREVSDESQAHPQVIEMLANLSRRIVALEKKINRLEQTDHSLHRDIETWAQEVERLKGRTKTELRGDRGIGQQLPGYICDFSIEHSCEGCYRVDFTVKGAPTRESVEKSLKEVLDLIYDSAEEE